MEHLGMWESLIERKMTDDVNLNASIINILKQVYVFVVGVHMKGRSVQARYIVIIMKKKKNNNNGLPKRVSRCCLYVVVNNL